jgi:hypothetical protein
MTQIGQNITSSVPNLKFNGLAINHDHFGHERRPNGRLTVWFEIIRDESQNQTGLSHSSISQKHNLNFAWFTFTHFQ